MKFHGTPSCGSRDFHAYGQTDGVSNFNRRPAGMLTCLKAAMKEK
jgi:hypothetical protein